MKYIKYLLVLLTLNAQAVNYSTPQQVTNAINAMAITRANGGYISNELSLVHNSPLFRYDITTNNSLARNFYMQWNGVTYDIMAGSIYFGTNYPGLSGGLYQLASYYSPMQLYVGNSSMYLQSNGYIGFNTTIPTNTFDFNGPISSRSGYIFPDGSMQTTASGSGTNSTNINQIFVGQSGVTNLTTIDTNGWIKFQGIARPWKCLSVPVFQMAMPTNPAWQPTISESMAKHRYEFAYGATNVLYFYTRLPLDYAPGTPIYVQLGYEKITFDSGLISFGFIYALINKNDTSNLIYNTNIFSVAADPFQHNTVDLLNGNALVNTNSAGTTLNAMIKGTIFRQGGADTYPNSIAIHSIDFYYQANTHGVNAVFSGGK